MVPKELRRVSSVPTISIGKPDRRVVMASGFDSDG
jgi:hypothetical protein